MDLTEKILNRGVAEIIERNHLEFALHSGKKLRVKFGIDPTAPEIHLGHTVALRKLRQFQDAGHKAVLIIGDFTAQIGDPSGRSETRKPLSEKEIKSNLKNYLKEAGKVINAKKAEVHHNSEWYKKGGLKNFLEITRAVTEQQLREREDFQKRELERSPITTLEILYPLLQGYDSVAVRADVELGGTDQKFNLLMGRRVQRYFKIEEQDVLMTPLIEGTDGVKKMSKSYENYIGISENPKDMFGKLMQTPDVLIEKYFELLTDLDMPRDLSPYESKMLLGETIVGMYHSEKLANNAREDFVKTFSKKEAPEDLPELKIKKGILTLDLVLVAGKISKSEARRLIAQGAISIDGEKIENPASVINSGMVLKIGKHKFFHLDWK